MLENYSKIKSGVDTGYVDYDAFKVGEVKSSLNIGVVVYTMGSAYFKALPDAAKNELELYGIEVLVADSQNDISRQVSQIENFISQKVDGIIVNAVDPPSSINIVLDKAAKAGIPVVAVDSRLDSNYNNYLGMVGSDNESLGFAVGEYMANYLKTTKGVVEGTLAVLDGVEGNAAALGRYNGLWKGFESVDPNHKIKEVSHLYSGAWTEEAGIQMAENMMVANKHLDLIFGISDPFVVGANSAAKRVGRSEMLMGAVDGAKSALKLINDGTPIKIIAGQDPVGMGVIGARLLLDYINNGTLPEYRVMKIAPKISSVENISETYDANAPF